MDLKEAWDPYFSPGYELEVKASTRSGKMSRDSPRLLVYPSGAGAANIDPGRGKGEAQPQGGGRGAIYQNS